MGHPMNDIPDSPAAGQRGPADHSIRDQIVSAADEHFRHYGYGKTTVSDLAKAIGFSKAYIYKFFDSKQAIGEAICTNCLKEITDNAAARAAEGRSAPDRFRRLFRSIIDDTAEMLFQERKMHDIAAASCAENWGSAQRYLAQVAAMVERIVLDGREAGEFERKTPIDELTGAIMQVMKPFMHPMMLELDLDDIPERSGAVISLVLRSLAP
jgi:AcrR family transcriptional regulator